VFLFILESIGTSELLLIGIIALIFLGPRKLPQIARTIGKTMADFRKTTSEFKSTWEKEVDFAVEEESIKKQSEDMSAQQVARLGEAKPEDPAATPGALGAPEIKQIDSSAFKDLPQAAAAETPGPEAAEETQDSEQPEAPKPHGKQDWL
jgi:sec-independent protein translocase protein TatB